MPDSKRLIPILVIKGADKAIEQYKKAFGATETYPVARTSGGEVMHASLTIGASEIFISEENRAQDSIAGQNLGFYLYIPDADAAVKQAKSAGMSEAQPVQDMFWGDRMGSVEDAFGIKWMLATHVRDVTPQEMAQGMQQQSSGSA